MGLIVHRAELDSPYDNTNTVLIQDSYTYAENVRSIYMDLDRMIANTKLSRKQIYIIERIMLGYSLSDIANEFNTQKQEIQNILRSAAKRIQKTYHIDLINWLEISGRVKVKDDAQYKTCNMCNKTLNVRYFSTSSEHLGGYRQTCKVCRG